MRSMRYYLNLIENQDDFYVYHGGTYSGGEFNPRMRGEPGTLRPLGTGIYAGITPDHAQLYVKYSGDKGKVYKFKVSKDAKLYPWGGGAWRSETPEMQEWWKNKAMEIQKAFKDYGLISTTLTGRELDWSDVVSRGLANRETVRKLLVSLGVDGSKQDLGNGMVELVFYNPKVLELVK